MVLYLTIIKYSNQNPSCSYVQYSQIAARVVRKALKPELQADAAKRDIAGIKFRQWEGGKPVGKCLIDI